MMAGKVTASTEVNDGLGELIRYLLEAAWRRRLLILLPVTVFFLLSVLAVWSWPRMYAANLLIMLQERNNPNILRSNADIFRELRITVDEIETLLKSDRVLTSAVLDLRRGRGIPGDKEIQDEVKRLRSSLFVKVVGNELIEIELRDTAASGLGNKLAIVSTRFLETFLAREDSLKTARHFAIEQRSRDLKEARAALDAWLARQLSSPYLSAIALIDDAAGRETSAEVRLAAARQALGRPPRSCRDSRSNLTPSGKWSVPRAPSLLRRKTAPRLHASTAPLSTN
jgi:hypothetical protein